MKAYYLRMYEMNNVNPAVIYKGLDPEMVVSRRLKKTIPDGTPERKRESEAREHERGKEKPSFRKVVPHFLFSLKSLHAKPALFLPFFLSLPELSISLILQP